jgi:hypothetical protein
VSAKFYPSDGGNKYEFNGMPWSNAKRIGVRTGEYNLTDIPSNHPLSFLLSTSELTVLNGTSVKTKNGFSYYTGTMKIEILADFGIQSYDCDTHGSMGGLDNFVYSETCDTAPTPSPIASPP